MTTTTETVQDPIAALAERRLHADLTRSSVQVGVARGHWQIERVDGGLIVASISTAPTIHPPGSLALRIAALEYPDQPPTSTPWDLVGDCQLAADDRPKSGRAATVFRPDWEGGRALYHPCDRVAITGHPDWVREHADELWDPTDDISQLFRVVHTILNEV